MIQCASSGFPNGFFSWIDLRLSVLVEKPGISAVTCIKLSFLRVIFVFQSHKFSWCCSTPPCEALLSHMSGKHDSHVNFPGSSEVFAGRCRYQANEQTRRFFSHKISCHWLKQPERGRYFSHIKFRVCAENAVGSRSGRAKQSQSQPRNFM